MEEALLYVRPLYLRAESGKIPELKRVIVAYENKIAMEPTLEEAVARIFSRTGSGETFTEQLSGEGTAVPARTEDSGEGNLVNQLRDAFDAATQAQRQGDWAGYGEELKKLKAVIEQMEKSAGSPGR
jgi:hypothetical protein